MIKPDVEIDGRLGCDTLDLIFGFLVALTYRSHEEDRQTSLASSVSRCGITAVVNVPFTPVKSSMTGSETTINVLHDGNSPIFLQPRKCAFIIGHTLLYGAEFVKNVAAVTQ
jgi:hypothetical protein